MRTVLHQGMPLTSVCCDTGQQGGLTTATRPVFAALPSGEISAIVMIPVSLFCSNTSPSGFLTDML